MYLMIQNDKVANLEALTVLGLSTSKGSDKIGQFGSGQTHGVNLLLRNKLTPTIYLGDKELKFFTKSNLLGDKQYDEVWYDFNGSQTKLAMCLEFGELDWNSTDMALREFISNALDASGKEGTVVKIVDEVKPQNGFTRIFVPITESIRDYFNNLSTKFLHFIHRENEQFIEKSDNSPARIYRRGAFIRQVDSPLPSLFDYNLDIKIDECRNLNDNSCEKAAASALSVDDKAIEVFLKSVIQGDNMWEHEMYYGYFSIANSAYWKKCWKKLTKNSVICMSDLTKHIAQQKGYNAIIVTGNVYSILKRVGIPCDLDVLDKHEAEGGKTFEPTQAKITMQRVWRWLTEVNMTNDKKMPKLKCFDQNMDAGSIVHGYYKEGTVYINVDSEHCEQTMLEELAHYITGSTDMSRDFQEFAFKFATRMAKKR